MFHTNMDNENMDNEEESLAENLARTRRMALLCGILGCVMMTISILGLMY